jgi:hypothetical protein
MLIPLTLPPPVRQFLADGVQLLIARLGALTEEFRAGLIAAIGRTLADGAEHLMGRVFLPGRRSPVADDFNAFDDDQDESRSVVDPDDEIEFNSPDGNRFEGDETLDESSPEWNSANGSPPSSLMVHALVTAGLNVLGVWLLRVELVPTSAVIALLGGMMLMVRKS